MKNTGKLKPYSYSYDKKNLESNSHMRRKNPSLNPDKIYFFRTSLFTEKSKNFIQKLNSCEKNKSNFNSNIKNEESSPQIDTTNQANKIPMKLKKGKIIFSQNKNINKSDIEEHHTPIINSKAKKDFNRNPFVNKSSNDLINQNLSSNISHINDEKDNDNITIDKKESIDNPEETKRVMAIKNLKKIKKEKLFTPLNNILNNNTNKKTIIVNYINNNHSINYLANANSRQKQINKDKVTKIETTQKIRYRLKSQRNSSQNKKAENKNIISFGSIMNKNLQNDLKNLKAINNHYNKKSSSIFDENYYFSRYKLGNYHAKKNNRYGSISSNSNINNIMRNTMGGGEILNSKKKIRFSLDKKKNF